MHPAIKRQWDPIWRARFVYAAGSLLLWFHACHYKKLELKYFSMLFFIFIWDILRLVSSCSQVQFHHVLREANFLEDAIANMGHVGGHQSWENSLLSNASSAFIPDQLGLGCPRGFSLYTLGFCFQFSVSYRGKNRYVLFVMN